MPKKSLSPKLLILLAIIVCIYCLLFATTSSEVQAPTEAEGETITIVGTVVYKDFEGGFYSIEGNDGEKYKPLNLPGDYQQDGIKVRVKVKVQPETMGIQMYGTAVEIIEIHSRP